MEKINGEEVENYFVEWEESKNSYHIVDTHKNHVFGLGNNYDTENKKAFNKSFLEYLAMHLNYAFAQGFFWKDGFVIYDKSSFIKILDDKYKEWTDLAKGE